MPGYRDSLGFEFGPHVLRVDPDIISKRKESIPDIYSVEEDGRTYHGWMAGEYALPNDEEEQSRQDFQHIMYKEMLDGQLALAPLTHPEHVLDIGTGTGVWATEFAEHHPTARVVGTDLSLIQPTTTGTPNCEFLLHNSETDPWHFAQRFDYVHLRSMGPCFADFDRVLAKCFDGMSPGGWVEVQDGDWSSYRCVDDSDRTPSPDGASIQTWFDCLVRGGRAMGRDMTKARHAKADLARAGFVDIVEERCPMPGSPWPQDPKEKRVGMLVGTAALTAADSYRKLMGLAGLAPGEVDELVARVKRDLRRIDVHWFGMAYFVYGRKPYKGEVVEKQFVDRS